jgi:hypothetical protein
MRIHGVGLVFACGALCCALAACGYQRAQVVNEAPTLMMGMPKEQLLACMGQPVRKANEGPAEVWSYNSGDGSVDPMVVRSENFSGPPPSNQASCIVNITIAGGRVSKMSYLSPEGEPMKTNTQCSYALQKCFQ